MLRVHTLYKHVLWIPGFGVYLPSRMASNHTSARFRQLNLFITSTVQSSSVPQLLTFFYILYTAYDHGYRVAVATPPFAFLMLPSPGYHCS